MDCACDKINQYSDTTGIIAFKSSTGAIVLQKNDGNDISVRNIITADGSAISARQLDEFGEVIQTESVASGEYLISGGQIKITSAASFQVESGLNIINNANSEFLSGFVQKNHNVASNSTEYNFNVFDHKCS